MDQAVRNEFNGTVHQVHTFVALLVNMVPNFIEKFSVHCEGDSDREHFLSSLVAASYPTYTAAAHALGISIEVVKRRVHRLSWGNARLHLLGTLEGEDPELVARLTDIHGYETWPGHYFTRSETEPTKAPGVSPEPAVVMQESINPAPECTSKTEGQPFEQRIRDLIMARIFQYPEFADRVVDTYIHAINLKEFLLSCPIDLLGLGFSTRTRKCLREEKIDTLGQLIEQTEEGLLEIRNFGKISLQEIIDKLAKLELKLKESPPLAS